jgi:hypothetical protein
MILDFGRRLPGSLCTSGSIYGYRAPVNLSRVHGGFTKFSRSNRDSCCGLCRYVYILPTTIHTRTCCRLDMT